MKVGAEVSGGNVDPQGSVISPVLFNIMINYHFANLEPRMHSMHHTQMVGTSG